MDNWLLPMWEWMDFLPFLLSLPDEGGLTSVYPRTVKSQRDPSLLPNSHQDTEVTVSPTEDREAVLHLNFMSSGSDTLLTTSFGKANQVLFSVQTLLSNQCKSCISHEAPHRPPSLVCISSPPVCSQPLALGVFHLLLWLTNYTCVYKFYLICAQKLRMGLQHCKTSQCSYFTDENTVVQEVLWKLKSIMQPVNFGSMNDVLSSSLCFY